MCAQTAGAAISVDGWWRTRCTPGGRALQIARQSVVAGMGLSLAAMGHRLARTSAAVYGGRLIRRQAREATGWPSSY